MRGHDIQIISPPVISPALTGNSYGCSWASWVVIVVKNSLAGAGDIRDKGSIPGLGKSPGGGHGNSLWYSYQEAYRQRTLAGYSP